MLDRLTGDSVSRRDFMKAAVAIGGASALSACLDRDDTSIPQGTDDPSELPARQHAWDEYLATDEHGNVANARHHALLLLDYSGEGTPTDAEREQMEAALQTLEQAYEWSNEGLVFTVGYTPYYFDRFDGDLPDSVDLPKPEPLAPFEDPEFDDVDAAIHLGSDHAKVVLEAEEALFGEVDEANGVAVEDTLGDVFEVRERRTGFVGRGLPAENDDADGVPEGEVPEEAPLFMGFKSGFKQNQASEDRVTISEGPFAEGTTQHVSKLQLHLDQWYNQDSFERRVALMFSPAHAEEDAIEGAAHNLEDSSLVDELGIVDSIEDDAFERGAVGHTQKSARAREDGEPIILRRDFDTTDDGQAGLHFLAVHETIEDFVKTREAMNGTDLAGTGAVGEQTNNGILQYFTTTRRGNYLLPPRDHRALPSPNPE